MIELFVWMLIIGIISIFMFFKIILFNYFQKKDPDPSLSIMMICALIFVIILSFINLIVRHIF